MTTAKEKLEKLTHSWYGFAVFSSVFGLLMNGLGVFSIGSAAFGLIVNVLIVWFLGKRLANKSRFWRFILLVLSALGVLTGVFGAGKLTWTFFHEWSLSLLAYAFYTAVGGYMNAKSFRVLTDKSVKAYFG